MYLARIVTKSTLENVPSYIEVTDKEGDYSIPTLIIGKKRAISLFGAENVHVLDRKIDERRVEFEEDTAKFIENIRKSLTFKINYYFINIFTEKLSFLKSFIDYMYGDEEKSVYVTKNHVYIYGGKSVIGLSLADFEYAGISPKKIIKKIRSNPQNIVFYESDVPEEQLKQYKNNNIIVPYLHYLAL